MKGSMIEVHAGSPRGALLATAEVPVVEKLSDPIKLSEVRMNNTGQQDLFFVFKNTDVKKENILFLDWIYFDNGKMTVPKP